MRGAGVTTSKVRTLVLHFSSCHTRIPAVPHFAI